MSSIDTRNAFFPNSRSARETRLKSARETFLNRNTDERARQLQEQSADHAKVDISGTIRDFSKIKRAVDAAPPIDNSAKIASLKAQIADGSYKMDYEAIADKMLESEF
jgi:negative regulator of flagellin synthesis FlgM